MKFKVSSTALLNNIKHLQGVTAKSSTLPILDHLLIEVSKGTLLATANDLTLSATAAMVVESKDNGSIAIPAGRLVKILKALKGQHLTFVISKGFDVTITCDQGTYVIKGEDPKEYPKHKVIEKPSFLSFPASVLSKVIKQTLWAVGNDDLRPVMSGILFHISTDGIKFVSTDAHRLVVVSREDIKWTSEVSLIVPHDTADLLGKYLGSTSSNVLMAFNDMDVSFGFDNIHIVSRLIDGKYPKYEEVLPKNNPNKLTVDRHELLSVTRRLSIFANTVTHHIRLDMAKGGVFVRAENLDTGDRAKEELASSYKGEAQSIGFNIRFLSAALKCLPGGQVDINMSKPNKAAIITEVSPKDTEQKMLVLLMPVMLHD